jgi:hypothetical protein
MCCDNLLLCVFPVEQMACVIRSASPTRIPPRVSGKPEVKKTTRTRDRSASPTKQKEEKKKESKWCPKCEHFAEHISTCDTCNNKGCVECQGECIRCGKTGCAGKCLNLCEGCGAEICVINCKGVKCCSKPRTQSQEEEDEENKEEEEEERVNLFAVGERDHGQLYINVTTTEYHPFAEWMPFITWDEEFEETDPMETTFHCQESRLHEVRRIMHQHGYQEEAPPEEKKDVRVFYITRNKNGMLWITIDSREHHPFHEWMPFVTWDGHVIETEPASYDLSFLPSRLHEVRRIMHQHGFQEIQEEQEDENLA